MIKLYKKINIRPTLTIIYAYSKSMAIGNHYMHGNSKSEKTIIFCAYGS